MPHGNAWLAQRQAEHCALTRLVAAMQAAPGRAVQGTGCRSAAKATAAHQAIRRLVKRGEPATFRAVQREASVSHAGQHSRGVMGAQTVAVDELREAGAVTLPKWRI
jgi:hypothetical protein